jgi:phosphatidylglycerol---prolipoprotein diacylglyceryl transferase
METGQQVQELKGILPVLFRIGRVGIPSYTFFIVMGILTGALVYYHEAKRTGQTSEFTFLIAVGAFVGSTIGSKLLELILNLDRVNTMNDLTGILFSGRTVIGGIIGGTLGVWFVKKVGGFKGKKGNLFAPAVALGIAVGRIGCFLNGCCYGKASTLPWAVDFGDGIPRHPTQLYESAFMLIMFFFVKYGLPNGKNIPGYLFKVLMIAYFSYRFLVEFIRVERVAVFGLTWFQIISFFVLIYLISSEKGLFLKQITSYGKSGITQPGRQS